MYFAKSQLRGNPVTCFVLMAYCAMVSAAIAQQVNPIDSVPSASSAVDASTPGDVTPGGASNLLSLSATASLVCDVTLVTGISHVPAPLKITVTDYVFEAHEVFKGDWKEKFVTIRNVGGELPNGIGMETLESLKLQPKQRYLIAASKTKSGFRLDDVWQVSADGGTVADASGRILIGVRGDVALTQSTPALPSLRYLSSPRSKELRSVGPPNLGSHPISKGADTAPAIGDPVSAEKLKAVLRQRAAQKRSDDLLPHGSGAAPQVAPPSMIAGGYVGESHNFYALMPDNNNWDWFQACAGNWNKLVNPSPSGRNWLIGYFNDSNGNPIRNVAPVANNGRNNLGVTTDTQMTDGGYDTWANLGANGVCYRWYETTNGRMKETDVLINPAIASNEAQYRKSLTHEFGHALNLDHEDRYFALLYPGTWRQPPNYASWWYARADDMLGVRSRLEWVNGNIAADRWNLASFHDMAVWSQAHETPGSSGNLVMSSVSSLTVNRGDRLTFRNAQIENRGDAAATNVVLRFYLSWNPIVSNIDTEIGSYTWNNFQGHSFWSGPMDTTVPNSLAPGTYYAGWVVTSDAGDATESNNTALLLQDSSANFAPQTIIVR